MPRAMFVHRSTSPFVKAPAACLVTDHVTQQPVPTKLSKQSYHVTKQFGRTKTDGKTNGWIGCIGCRNTKRT